MPRKPLLTYALVRDARSAKQVKLFLQDPHEVSLALTVEGKRGETLLHAAVRSNVPETVAAIAELGGAVLLSRPNIYGETPLHTALKLRYTGSAVARHIEIVKMLLAKRAVDLNAFSKPKWIKGQHSTSRSRWRLNVLRFAIAHNQSDTILDLLEAHGAVIGYDPDGTDKPPRRRGTAKGEVDDMSFTRRLPFFLGLATMDAADNHADRQQLMLRRYPQHIRRLGAPTTQELLRFAGRRPAAMEVYERVIGVEVIASPLTNWLDQTTPYALDVTICEGGVTHGASIGSLLRGSRDKTWVEDALLLSHGFSTHQYIGRYDYRELPSYFGPKPPLLTLSEMQAPVLFEAAELV